jgi:hypothetical protein
MVGEPEMADGDVFTVPVTVRLHPDANVYIIDTVPADTPQNEPVEVPTVPAAPIADHVPPAGLPVSVLHAPSHTCKDPMTPVGNGLTSMVVVRKQPEGKE